MKLTQKYMKIVRACLIMILLSSCSSEPQLLKVAKKLQSDTSLLSEFTVAEISIDSSANYYKEVEKQVTDALATKLPAKYVAQLEAQKRIASSIIQNLNVEGNRIVAIGKEDSTGTKGVYLYEFTTPISEITSQADIELVNSFTKEHQQGEYFYGKGNYLLTVDHSMIADYEVVFNNFNALDITKI